MYRTTQQHTKRYPPHPVAVKCGGRAVWGWDVDREVCSRRHKEKATVNVVFCVCDGHFVHGCVCVCIIWFQFALFDFDAFHYTDTHTQTHTVEWIPMIPSRCALPHQSRRPHRPNGNDTTTACRETVCVHIYASGCVVDGPECEISKEWWAFWGGGVG